MEYFTKIRERLLISPFPLPNIMYDLAKYLNFTYAQNYRIYNLSEYHYDTTLFNHQVVEYVFTGYPCMSLKTSFCLCEEINKWLHESKDHVAIFHCQASQVIIL